MFEDGQAATSKFLLELHYQYKILIENNIEEEHTENPEVTLPSE